MVWSASSGQVLNSRNGIQEGRSILRTACTTGFVMAFTMSKSFVAGGSTWARTRLLQRCAASGDEYRRAEVTDPILVTHKVRDRRPTLRQDEVGHVVRFDNRDLVAHGGHPRQVRPVFSGLSRPFSSPPRPSRSSHRDPVVRLRVAGGPTI